MNREKDIDQCVSTFLSRSYPDWTVIERVDGDMLLQNINDPNRISVLLCRIRFKDGFGKGKCILHIDAHATKRCNNRLFKRWPANMEPTLKNAWNIIDSNDDIATLNEHSSLLNTKIRNKL